MQVLEKPERALSSLKLVVVSHPMWVVGIDPGSSVRTVGVLNH